MVRSEYLIFYGSNNTKDLIFQQYYRLKGIFLWFVRFTYH